MIVNLMRTNQRWMMMIISILVIISFIWFFSNRAQYDRMGNDRVGSVYGRSLSNTDFERTIRQLRTAEDLGLSSLTAPEVFSPRDLISSAMNYIVLTHEASKLGIEPTDAEVDEASKKIPAFQAPGGGGFDPVRYADFVDKKLGPRGFSDRQVDELVRADLQIGKLRQVVDAPELVSPVEVRLAYETAFTKTEASVIRLQKAAFAAAVNPTEEDIKKYFDGQKNNLKHPEKRKISYVVFGLDETQSKLAGKERVEAMKPKAEAAEKFIEALADGKGKADFNALAAEAKTPVKESPEFEETALNGPEASIPRFAETSFHLTKDEPNSDVIDTPTAYYILHLASVTPEKPMTLDEARPKIIAALKDERAQVALAAKAEEIRTKIVAALKAGKPIAEAAKDAGETAQDLPAFSLAEPSNGFADAEEIRDAATELNAGELSKLVNTPDGGALVYVRTREGVDEKSFDEKKEMISNSLRMRKERYAFMEWLRAQREAANVHLDGQMGGNAEG